MLEYLFLKSCWSPRKSIVGLFRILVWCCYHTQYSFLSFEQVFSIEIVKKDMIRVGSSKQNALFFHKVCLIKHFYYYLLNSRKLSQLLRTVIKINYIWKMIFFVQSKKNFLRISMICFFTNVDTQSIFYVSRFCETLCKRSAQL